MMPDKPAPYVCYECQSTPEDGQCGNCLKGGCTCPCNTVPEGMGRDVTLTEVRKLLAEIGNLAHKAWLDPKNLEYIFKQIENRASDGPATYK